MMYQSFYNLSQAPFNITCDPDVFFEGASHKEALAALLYGIKERKGIILVTGEVGTGKTTLCKELLERLDQTVRTSLILNPYFSETQLMQAVIADFGLEPSKKAKLEIINRLNSFLVDISSAGGNAVLIIDEAQDLTPKQLEQIRLLSNLETPKDKLLQIVLMGQPELEKKLNLFKLRQIHQRIFVKHRLLPLSRQEVKDYIHFRLHKSGGSHIHITEGSYKLIYDFSGGIPRKINLLCDRALLCGFARDKTILDEEIFKACIEEIK